MQMVAVAIGRKPCVELELGGGGAVAGVAGGAALAGSCGLVARLGVGLALVAWPLVALRRCVACLCPCRCCFLARVSFPSVAVELSGGRVVGALRCMVRLLCLLPLSLGLFFGLPLSGFPRISWSCCGFVEDPPSPQKIRTDVL